MTDRFQTADHMRDCLECLLSCDWIRDEEKIDRLLLKHFAVERLKYVNIYTIMYALNMKIEYYKYDKGWNKKGE